MYYWNTESYLFNIFHKLKLDANYIFIIFLVLKDVLLQIKFLLPNIVECYYKTFV